MSGEVRIEIEDKPTAVSIMRELVGHLLGSSKRSNERSSAIPRSDEYRKALKSIGERLAIRGGVTAITAKDGPRKTPTKSCRFHRRKIITSHL